MTSTDGGLHRGCLYCSLVASLLKQTENIPQSKIFSEQRKNKTAEKDTEVVLNSSRVE